MSMGWSGGRQFWPCSAGYVCSRLVSSTVTDALSVPVLEGDAEVRCFNASAKIKKFNALGWPGSSKSEIQMPWQALAAFA